MERQERTHQKCRSFPKYLVRSCEIEEGLVPFALDMSGSLVRGLEFRVFLLVAREVSVCLGPASRSTLWWCLNGFDAQCKFFFPLLSTDGYFLFLNMTDTKEIVTNMSTYRHLCFYYVAGSGAKLELRNFVHSILKHDFNGGIGKYTVSKCSWLRSVYYDYCTQVFSQILQLHTHKIWINM